MSNWWADKLGTTQPRATNLPPMPPSQQPMTMAPPAVTQQPNLPQSAVQVSSCPECRSRNYGSFEGARARCYDCGYPLKQSGSGFRSYLHSKQSAGFIFICEIDWIPKPHRIEVVRKLC